MKFANIYSETESRLRSALLSLWTPGHHPMRQTIDKLLHDEPLLAEPTFQSMFAWLPTQDTDWREYLNHDVISRCEIGANYRPYRHQTDSWQALQNKQSIVVTSGTGSGKTECFMYPVLSDLYEQQKQDPNLHAIQALFLYPLNALMEDQKKRLSKYCSQVGNLSFAVYNSNTPETHLNGANPLPSEVETRDGIRNQCPPILLTNPSMLEYILVRDKDQDMLAKSQGKLRWIILDEVHTYTGSAAVELAFQIKRILNAFGVTPDQVRFVCTSATVNDANGVQSLIDFISYVTGQNQGKISVIDGERLVPNIDADWLNQQLQQSQIPTTADNVITLRSSINQSMGMGLQQIWSILCPTAKYDAQKALELLDFLCELKQKNNPVLSLRAHFYMRSIEGLYACANDECMAKNDEVYHFGHITTYKSTVCPHCGLPMMEILQCKRCGSFILSGDSESDAPHRITMHDSVIDTDDYFALDDTIEEEENDNTPIDAEEFFLLPYTENYFNPKKTYRTLRYNITHNAKQSSKTHSDSGQWAELRNPGNNSPYCPSCAKLARGKRLNLKHFRIPVDFINQTIAPVLLQECGTNGNWGKYIAFTDSRQGTAISAKRFNVESERIYGRSKVAEELASAAETQLPAGLSVYLPTHVLAELGNTPVTKRFYDLSNYLFNQDIFNHLTGTPNANSTGYKRALVRSFIGRRPMYETNVETMGLVTLDYQFDVSAIPNFVQTFCTNNNLEISVDEWKNFLKLILDYFVRFGQHIQYSTSDEEVFLREVDKSTPIRRSKFPLIKTEDDDDPNSKVVANQPRIILILCAGLGVHTIQQLQNSKNDLNDMLNYAYDWLCQNKLTRVYPNDGGYGNSYGDYDYYYYLDLSIDSDKAVIRRTEKVSVCPVTNTLLDTTFCGYSPLIIGELSPELCHKYKCTNSLQMPKYDPNDPNWLQNDPNVQTLKKQSLWNSRYDDVYKVRPPYLAAEHSAQQSHDLLDEYVQAFRAGNINVLHCSTTMEMGVDIGDLDIVLMDTIPPTAANYLQRVGRAGRSGQTKALAFSLCNATPVGQNAFFNPTWWMGNSASYVPTQCNRHQSNTIIQRHINSYFLRNFLVSQGISGVSKIDDFMSPQNGKISTCGRFRLYLRGIKGNLNEQTCYAKVFGSVIPFIDAVTRAEKTIVSIRNEYWDIMNSLTSACAAHTVNNSQVLALSHQMDSLMNINMLQYLSEHQFIPNANMPTGIVIFNYMYLEKVQEYEKLMRQLQQEKNKPQTPLTQDKIKDLLLDIANLDMYSKASRDVRTALNEYVPGQTVVINEKNYKSAGVSFRGDYNQQTKRKVLYFCPQCGHTEYRVLGNNANIPACCPICNHTYHGIFDRKNTNFTIAYEPVEFMVDQNLNATRYERENKEFYDIQPLFLDVNPNVQTQINMCDIAGSGEQGEILFYNAGHGFGFSICKKCGRAMVDVDPNQTSPIKIPHKPLWHSRRNCTANNEDILRNVVLTGRQQTCYAVLRLYEDANRTTPCNNEKLAYSLGVVVKYALAKYLKVDESEIDFGVKKERNNYSLFIYDTARGGCGYSLQLTDPAICQEVFGIARQKLLIANCDCEKGTGACPRCLVDRNSFRYAHKLSKALALEWLNKQQLVSVQLPANLANTNTGIIYQSLKHIATAAAGNKEVKAITFCISDQYGCCVSDWLSSRSAIGSILQEVRNTAKQLNIKIEYDPRLHSTLADQYPYITLQVPDADVKFVKSFEDTNKYKTALIIEYAKGQVTRYFVDNSNFGSLSFSDAWGDTSYSFSDNMLPTFAMQQQPQLPPQPTEIVRTGFAKVNGFRLDDFYAKVIEPILQAGDDGIMNTILKGKVEISFSDPYVNSALASLMLVYLIKELKDKYHFTINNLTLTVDYDDRYKGFAKNVCYDYTYINLNFGSAQDADDYTESLCDQILGITPNFNEYNDPDHYRWIRFTNAQGKFIEIRMDYGISGGWQSRKQYLDLKRLNSTNVYIDKKDKDILYYIIIYQ